MAKYKMVNGKKIKLTSAEEKARKDEIEITEKDIQERAELKNQKQTNKESGRQKLKDLGLDDDEIDALIN